MKIIGFGLQRQRHQTPLDIWYPIIITDADEIIESLSRIISLETNTFIPLNT